jgi:predicted adenine nucleotide alpha hydrolase (AANH) superfamily ATPase
LTETEGCARIQTDEMEERCGVVYDKMLLHICCAPCCIGVYPELGRVASEVEGFFFNPNIHPLLEFRRRLKSVKVLAEQTGMQVHCDEEYLLKEFLRATVFNEDDRCAMCYKWRMRRTAEFAKDNGFDAFTTTLLISGHQRHESLAREGRAAAAEYGREFYYRDFRPLAEDARREAKRRNLYLQQFCGCIYSEWVRYRDSKEHLYKGGRACSNV